MTQSGARIDPELGSHHPERGCMDPEGGCFSSERRFPRAGGSNYFPDEVIDLRAGDADVHELADRGGLLE